MFHCMKLQCDMILKLENNTKLGEIRKTVFQMSAIFCDFQPIGPLASLGPKKIEQPNKTETCEPNLKEP